MFVFLIAICRNDKSTVWPRRLWHFLITKKCLHDTFIRFIFKKKKKMIGEQASSATTFRLDSTASTTATSSAAVTPTPGAATSLANGFFANIYGGGGGGGTSSAAASEAAELAASSGPLMLPAYKIVHKDQDAIYSFCLNEKDKSALALCTGKEIIELDMRHLLVRSNAAAAAAAAAAATAATVALDDECEMDILAMNK